MNTNLKLLQPIPITWNLPTRNTPTGQHTNVSLNCNDCTHYSGIPGKDYIQLATGPGQGIPYCCNKSGSGTINPTDKNIIIWDNTGLSTLKPNYLSTCSNAGQMWGKKNPLQPSPLSTQVNISDKNSDQYYYCPTGR